MPDTDAFARCFRLTVGEEGGYAADPDDPGNWTGGRVGLGACRGTKFGISAASYPALDIAALTLDDARAIYLRDYWQKIAGDSLPPPLAVLVFDAAVNAGVEAASRWLQRGLGVAVDGEIGPRTCAAIPPSSENLKALCASFQATRLDALPPDPRFRNGWQRRILRVMLAAGEAFGAQ